MIRLIFLSIFFVISLSTSGSTQSLKDLFKKKSKVTWVGVDFSHMKLIGDFSQFYEFGNKSTAELKDVYFPAWNTIVLKESKKFDLRGMLRKDDLRYDLDMINLLNDETDLGELEDYNTPEYNKAELQEFLTEYDIEDSEGLGVVLICESFNKNYDEAIFHIVVFSMGSKQMLINQRITGEPSGIGIKNYWANSIHRALKTVKKKYYKQWKKKYK